MLPSDFTTTSFGRLRRRPWKLLAITVMLPSASCRVTRRESCSAASSRPCRSRVRPLARLVGSLNNVTPCPGVYFMRRLLWMSLNRRYPPSFHHTGPSAGPRSPPKPEASSWIGSDVAMILSSSGASCSILRAGACANARPVSANPPAAEAVCKRCRRDRPVFVRMSSLPFGLADHLHSTSAILHLLETDDILVILAGYSR